MVTSRIINPSSVVWERDVCFSETEQGESPAWLTCRYAVTELYMSKSLILAR